MSGVEDAAKAGMEYMPNDISDKTINSFFILSVVADSRYIKPSAEKLNSAMVMFPD